MNILSEVRYYQKKCKLLEDCLDPDKDGMITDRILKHFIANNTFRLKTIKRIIQKISGIHKIHHVQFSYGWKIPFFNSAWFKHSGLQKLKKIKIKGKLTEAYHNCTLTGIY